jgi:glycerol-3-phosphate O-acyltransferase/dihydroxyacetone phosphate acyltransferase
MLRLTAKSTQFGHRTLTSWLIESAGTIPIKRRKDFADGKFDNTEAMQKLLEARHLFYTSFIAQNTLKLGAGIG